MSFEIPKPVQLSVGEDEIEAVCEVPGNPDVFAVLVRDAVSRARPALVTLERHASASSDAGFTVAFDDRFEQPARSTTVPSPFGNPACAIAVAGEHIVMAINERIQIFERHLDGCGSALRRRLLAVLPPQPACDGNVRVSPDGGVLAVLRSHGALILVNVREAIAKFGCQSCSDPERPDLRSHAEPLLRIPSATASGETTTPQRKAAVVDLRRSGTVIIDASFSADGRNLVVVSFPHHVLVFDVATATLQTAATLVTHFFASLSVRCVALSPDGTRVALHVRASGRSTCVMQYDLLTGRECAPRCCYADVAVSSICFVEATSSPRRQLLGVIRESRLTLHDIERGDELAVAYPPRQHLVDADDEEAGARYAITFEGYIRFPESTTLVVPRHLIAADQTQGTVLRLICSDRDNKSKFSVMDVKQQQEPRHEAM